jgi:uncharacterized protein YqgC (DUF456 family)
MLADYISQKLSCDKFLGEIFCDRIGTLRGATRPVIGVTTLGSNGALVVSSVLIIVCDLVWYHCFKGEVKIGWDKLEGLLFSAALARACESPGV